MPSLFEIAQLIASLTVVWIGAKLIKALGDTFHGRHSFDQTFTVTAYGLSPLFLLRLLNSFPSVSPWVPGESASSCPPPSSTTVCPG